MPPYADATTERADAAHPDAPASAPSDRAPRERARVYRRRRLAVFGTLFLVVALCIGGGTYAATTLNAPIPAAAAQLSAPGALTASTQPVALPAFGAYAVGAVGFDGMLAEGGQDGPMPMASITKIITTLVVLDAHPIAAGQNGPDIAYTSKDVAIYDDMVAQNGSVAPVVPGTSLSLKDSLEAMLLPSGNNYAISITNWAFGGTDAFLAAARPWLTAHGLAHTRIVDPHGLSDQDVSTPADLVKLGELALRSPLVAGIVSTKSVDLPAIGTVTNTNKLLGTHGVDGIKTGTTDTAANLLFSAEVPVGSTRVTLVGVVLGGPTHPVVDDAIAKMIDSIVPGFHEVQVLKAGQVLAGYRTPWGQHASASASTSASVLVWSSTPVTVTVDAKPVKLAKRGDRVGTAVVHAGATIVSVPIVLDATLRDPGAWWRLTNPGRLDAPASPTAPATAG